MSLKLRTRAALLIAISFAALLATFLLLTFLAVKHSYEERTVEEMRSQLRAILEQLDRSPDAESLALQYELHGRTGESPLAISIWLGRTELGRIGPDSLRAHLPPDRVLAGRSSDSTFTVDEQFVVYAERYRSLTGVAVMSEHTTDEVIEEMIAIFDIVLIVGVLLSVFVAIVLSRVALDPISKLTTSTEALLGATKLGSRLPVPSSPLEAVTLAERFNLILKERDKSINTLKTFTADVAHELRTPLTILRGELEVELRSRPHGESERETLESCLEEVKHLSLIVEDLLYLARLENVAEPMQDKTDVVLADTVRSVASRLEPLRSEKAIQISLAVSNDLQIYASQAYIERLIYNLVLNAIQYTPHGGVISIGSKGNVLQIADTGIGMTPEAIAHVTERFYRVDSARTRQPGNIGLGLAIANSIAARYAISLQIKSQERQGTTIYLHFPDRT